MRHAECTNCALHKTAQSPGLGFDGSNDPDILIVFDYVSRHEDKIGKVAASGDSARSIVRSICESITTQTGLKFAYTTAVRCTPNELQENGTLKTRTPSTKEMDACSAWMKEDLKVLNPKVVVLTGATALKAVLGKQCKLGDMRGTPVWKEDRVYVPTWSPTNMLPGKRESSVTPEQYTEMIISDIATAANVATGTMTKPEEIVWKVVRTKQEALQVLADLSSAQHEIPMVALDIETNSYDGTEVDNIFKPGLKVLCVGLSWEEGKTYVVSLSQEECEYKDDIAFQREWVHALWAMKCKFVLQNGIYDFVALHLVYNVEPWHDYHDTILMHHLLWSHKRHALREMAKMYTPHGGYDDEVRSLVGALKSSQKGYHRIPFAAVARKNAYDAALTLHLGKRLHDLVSKDEQLLWVYNNITIPVTEPLMRMSLRGLAISEQDVRVASVNNEIMRHKITNILSETKEWKNAESILGSKPDVNKALHRSTILFNRECCGLQPIKVSQITGEPSMDKTVLAELAEKSDVAYGVLKLRELKTFQEKMLIPMPTWTGFDGRVHTTYKVYGTRTGRLSSADPNLQNLGRSSLHMIKAAPGYTLVVCDISQAEIRVNAVVCNEPVLLEAFSNGKGPDGKPVDIHATVAQDMFGISYEQAKTDEFVRRVVKGLNFGIAYGMTEHGLAPRIKKTPEEARELIELYFKKMPRIRKNLFEATKSMLIEDGYVRTLFGRYWYLDAEQKRVFEELKQKGMRSFWEKSGPARALRQAANARIQSPSADMTNSGLVKFYRTAKKLYDIGDLSVPYNERYADMYMANQVHDSVIVEARTEIAHEVATLLQQCMQTPEIPFDFPIPWVAEIKMGASMGDLYKVDL